MPSWAALSGDHAELELQGLELLTAIVKIARWLSHDAFTDVSSYDKQSEILKNIPP